MQIDISKVSEGNFSFTYEDNDINLELFLASIVTPIIVKGEYRETGNDVLVSGTIEYDIQYPCSRCVESVTEHYEQSFDELYSLISDEGFVIVDDIIDLTPMVNELIVLNINGRVLCKEDCKGLCPVCGTNLNINECDCNTSIDDISGDNPFAVLKDITTGGAKDGSTKKKNVKRKA